MELSNIDIEKLIPQRPPFVLVDSLLSHSQTSSQTTFRIDPDHLMVENGVLSAEGIIENIAQSAAAGMGYQSYESSSDPAIGYIAAISNIKIFELPAAGTEIQTLVEIEREVLSVTIIRGKAMQAGKSLAECQMKIFVHGE